MRKGFNIAGLIALAVAAWLTAGWVMSKLNIETVISGVRFAVAAFVPFVTIAGQMMWKVHDATKTPTDAERTSTRLRYKANLVMMRLWLITGACIAGSCLGAATAAFSPGSQTAAFLAQSALALLGFIIPLCFIYLPWLYFDLVALERLHSEKVAKAARRAELLAKLRADE